MNPISIVGAFIMTLSLLAYGIGSISLSRFRIVGSIVLIFLSLGIVFDVAAIVLMMMGAKGTPFTLHGLLGYSAFFIMLIDTVWAWHLYFKHGVDVTITKKYHLFARLAYFWWVVAYLTGSLIVLWR